MSNKVAHNVQGLAPVRGFLHFRLATFAFLKFVVQDKENAFVSSTLKLPPRVDFVDNLHFARIAPNPMLCAMVLSFTVNIETWNFSICKIDR